MGSLRWLGRGALAGVLFAGLAQAQFNFQLTLTENGNAVQIPNNANLAFNAPVGQSQSARVTATYYGFGQIAISQLPQLFGSTAFTVSLTTKLPIMLTNGGNFFFDIQFTPANSTQANAQINLPYAETVTGPAPTFSPVTTQGLINLTLQGTSPSIVLSYILQTDQNVVTVPPGGSVTFPATAINATAQATFNISNRGSGPAQINAISLSGSAFKIAGLPLFPVSVGAGQSLQIGIQYLPTAVGSDTGQLQITVDPNTVLSVAIHGSGTSSASAFAYQVVQGSTSTPLATGSTISAFPDTNVGETSSLSIQVQNTGTASGMVNSISISGAGFQLSDLPVLPQVLAPNASFTFTIMFAPAQPGTLTGRLSVGSDAFPLSGRGLGVNLKFSYTVGDATIPVTPTNASVVFSPVQVAKTAQLDFTVSNTGTLPATIANIGIGEPNSPFSLSGLPPLPVTVPPNTDFHFTISYSPVTTGFTNGTLRLDNTVVGLTGSGTVPPPLPSYTIQGPSGSVAPQTQPAVRLSLSSAYPLALAGTLTMTVSTDLTADPGVQFSTGGRTVPFTIPANSTDAIFAGQGPQIRLQAGTVASTITLTPSFATQPGGLDLTPSSPASIQFSVDPSPPVLISGRVSSITANGITLTLTGVSTTRTLTALNVQFAPVAGFSVPKTQFTVDLHQVSLAWFQSSGSQAFGGQFTVVAPFTFQGTPPAGHSLLDSVGSISMTVSNERGSSNSLQTAPQ
jgi:hypothetical protein